jgi:hypothetical protein
MDHGNRHLPAAIRAAALYAGLALSTTILPAAANAQQILQNGTFSQAVIGGVTQASQAAEFGSANNGFTPTQQLVGWSTAGYNFVYLPGTADTTGATGQATVKLWGPANSGTNAANLPLSSPTGGDYVASDGAYEVSPITQTLNGLKVGEELVVSFAWAGAQQSTFTGATSDKWTVSMGTVSASNPSQSTSVVQLPTEGASAWTYQTFTFIATSSTEVLSFLATGTPSGQPPFALLANVAVNVPEPASVLLMLSGLAGLVCLARRRGSFAASHLPAASGS